MLILHAETQAIAISFHAPKEVALAYLHAGLLTPDIPSSARARSGLTEPGRSAEDVLAERFTWVTQWGV
jgi:hypothetical protein